MKVCMQEVKLIYSDPAGWSTDMGRCAPLDISEMYIRSSMSKVIKDKTLIHEVCHFISNDNSLNLSESQVSTISVMVYKFIMDNRSAQINVADIHNHIFTHNNDCSIGMTEMQVAVLAYWLHQWIIDNPTIIDKIAKAEKHFKSNEIGGSNE